MWSFPDFSFGCSRGVVSRTCPYSVQADAGPSDTACLWGGKLEAQMLTSVASPVSVVISFLSRASQQVVLLAN